MKKFVSILLCISLALGIVYVSSYAAETVINGNLSENITYSFDAKTGTFHIEGNGDLPDCPKTGISFSSKNSVKSIIVNSGITKIGTDAFIKWNTAKSIYILNPQCVIDGANTIPKSTVIFAKANSAAQTYATANKRKFTALTESTCPGHKYGGNVLAAKATMSADGKYVKTCAICGKKVTTVVKKIASVTLSTTKYQYNGTLRRPVVTVKNENGTALTRNKHYTIAYPTNSIDMGTYNVEITFTGSYSGTKTLTFQIVPAASTISSVIPSFRAATVYWKKLSGITGYQIQYCTKSDFKSAKLVTVNNSVTNKSITGLSNNTAYYFRMRSYKAVSSGNVFSSWSSAKKITTYKAEKYHINKNGVDIRIVRGTYGTRTQRFDSKVSWQIVNPKTITYNPAYNIAVVTVDTPTKLHLSKGTNVTNVNVLAKKVGATIAITGQVLRNGKLYDTDISAVIRDGSLYKSFTGKGKIRQNLVMYKDGTWKFECLDNATAKKAIKNGAYNSFMYFDILIDNGKEVSGHIKDFNPTRNGSFLAQISPKKYILMTTEFMPISSAIKVLLQYGVKKAVYITGGNCAHLYVKGIGNTTGSTGKQIVGLDKVGYLETEWMAKYGLLQGKNGGGTCEHEVDVIYFK